MEVSFQAASFDYAQLDKPFKGHSFKALRQKN